MPEGKMKQKAENQSYSEENAGLMQILSDIDRLKERHESRRGPFIISDEDLNQQFQLNHSSCKD